MSVVTGVNKDVFTMQMPLVGVSMINGGKALPEVLDLVVSQVGHN